MLRFGILPGTVILLISAGAGTLPLTSDFSAWCVSRGLIIVGRPTRAGHLKLPPRASADGRRWPTVLLKGEPRDRRINPREPVAVVRE